MTTKVSPEKPNTGCFSLPSIHMCGICRVIRAGKLREACYLVIYTTEDNTGSMDPFSD
jgi:hypothetical protein